MPHDADETRDPTLQGRPPSGGPPATGPSADPAAPDAHASPPNDTARRNRYAPGQLLADRYRIVAFLGRGGMGEVYRADDLELAQSVALKILPARIAADTALADRVRAEVRLARGISHRNVCRIHDIARLPSTPERPEGGDLFISMEYIDGEDLQTLLRRIGKLPQDKAVDVARQLCAALAAAHDQGVIHRDLKPANIMIDGRGNVRLTDFGIAAVDDEIEEAEAHAGTPAYMAPEQFEGRGVSKQSDIYALGLIIFEVLTGKPAWKAESYAELKTMRDRGATPVGLNSISTAGVDPALAALVERCTETDPADRPASAMAVAAALPGADPIAAALAAGETPSPELIAAMGGKGALKPVTAAILALATVAAVALSLVLTRGTTLLTVAPPPAAPPLMEEAAYEILATLGHAQPEGGPVQTGWTISQPALQRVADAIANGDIESWDALAHPFADPFRFWFRIEPGGFDPADPAFGVSLDDPPRTQPGSISLVLDGDRQLKRLRIIPAHRVDSATTADEPDWSAAFTAAGLKIDDFEPIDAIYRDRADADTRRGWSGATPTADPSLPPLEIEVFAGAADGKITEFAILHPDADTGFAAEPGDKDEPTDSSFGRERVEPDSTAARVIAGIAQAIVVVIITLVASTLAYRNYRLGRGDVRRASRLGFAVFALFLIAAILGADVAPVTLEALVGPFPIYAIGLGFALILVACYIAAEPLARSRWPGSLVSWTRLLSGNFSDPMIGRDMLIGLLLGTATTFLFAIAQFTAPLTQGLRGPDVGHPTTNGVEFALNGPAAMLAQCVSRTANGLISAPAIALIVLIVMVLLGFLRIKQRWPAILIVVVIVAAQSLAIPNIGPLDRAAVMLSVVANLLVLARFGLLVIAVTFVASSLSGFFVDAAPFDQWWATAALTPPALLAAALIFSFRTSTAGKSLFANTTGTPP